MKRTLIIFGVTLLVLSSFTTSVKDSGKSICKAYFPLDEGTELMYDNFNGKGKLQSTDLLRVDKIIETAESMTIKVHSANFDKKGEETSNMDFDYICEDGVFKISMESMLDKQSMESFKDMDVTMTQSELLFPAVMVAGQKLPDAKITVTISSSGSQIMEMTVNITDRLVEAEESVKTEAGTFDCFKISQTSSLQMMFINKTVKSIDWIAENVGSIRSESYSEKGKLQTYRELKSIKK